MRLQVQGVRVVRDFRCLCSAFVCWGVCVRMRTSCGCDGYYLTDTGDGETGDDDNAAASTWQTTATTTTTATHNDATTNEQTTHTHTHSGGGSMMNSLWSTSRRLYNCCGYVRKPRDGKKSVVVRGSHWTKKTQHKLYVVNAAFVCAVCAVCKRFKCLVVLVAAA